jgi:quercetin dioxygenase-like cupin family protein
VNKRVAASLVATIVVFFAALGAACADNRGEQVLTPARGVTEVTRQSLADATSPRAPGQTISLSRVVIPAGQEIAPHTHPGAQLATIAEGTLTYSVIRGEVRIIRAAGSGQAREETVTAGQSVEVRPGDALIETPDMVHNAKNNGRMAVVIYLSALFPDGAPASSPAR